MSAETYTCYCAPGTFLGLSYILPAVVFKQPYEIGTINTPISQMRKLRHYSRSYRTENWNLNPSSVDEIMPLPTVPCYASATCSVTSPTTAHLADLIPAIAN